MATTTGKFTIQIDIESGPESAPLQTTLPPTTIDTRSWGPSWTAKEVADRAVETLLSAPKQGPDGRVWRGRLQVWDGADADTSAEPAFTVWWPATVTGPAPEVQTVLDQLNTYDGQDVWGDVIYRLDGLDHDATALIDQAMGDRFVIHGRVIRRDEAASRWIDSASFADAAGITPLDPEQTITLLGQPIPIVKVVRVMYERIAGVYGAAPYDAWEAAYHVLKEVFGRGLYSNASHTELDACAHQVAVALATAGDAQFDTQTAAATGRVEMETKQRARTVMRYAYPPLASLSQCVVDDERQLAHLVAGPTDDPDETADDDPPTARPAGPFPYANDGRAGWRITQRIRTLLAEHNLSPDDITPHTNPLLLGQLYGLAAALTAVWTYLRPFHTTTDADDDAFQAREILAYAFTVDAECARWARRQADDDSAERAIQSLEQSGRLAMRSAND